MKPTATHLKENATRAMADPALRSSLDRMKTGFSSKRAAARDRLPEFDALRDRARDIKNDVLAHLDHYLEVFERKVNEAGGTVHWCADAEEANRAILGICQRLDAKTVTKGKSMISEEIGLNDYLEKNGVIPIETDLGEYIIQLRHETPSHIIAPAIHLQMSQVSDTFREHHTHLDPARQLAEPPQLMGEARAELRGRFIAADVGVTGANFLIAETGSTVIVTNEGNGDLTQTLPKAHVVVASIEKIVPTLEDASTLMRLLARSATGQELSVYTTFSTGPRRTEDPDGPGEFHVVLLDNGRTELLGSEFQEMLRCIRCGACLNHCPVYGAIGGHAYGWVYPGPMGSVLSPGIVGIEDTANMPNASTLCGRCEAVCPMHIPLPRMLRAWREREFDKGITPAVARWGLGIWAALATRPALYRLVTGTVIRTLGALGRGHGHFLNLPLADGWTRHRDMPAPEGATFMQQYKSGRRAAR